jgi:hypothetical protein
MTVSELIEILNKIPVEYKNCQVLVEDEKYNLFSVLPYFQPYLKGNRMIFDGVSFYGNE